MTKNQIIQALLEHLYKKIILGHKRQSERVSNIRNCNLFFVTVCTPHTWWHSIWHLGANYITDRQLRPACIWYPGRHDKVYCTCDWEQ